MRVLSLFSGGGLGDYGLTLAGMEIVGQVEIDEYCQKILKLRWPNVPKWGDIRTVHAKSSCPIANANSQRLERERPNDQAQGREATGGQIGLRNRTAAGDTGCEGCLGIETIDLISGGFPCQDISTAGKGAGILGERSGLWKEMLRIIREVRPRYVLVENVAALLGRGLGVVLGDLAESGYDAGWDCIPASALGAPHQRDRVWLVGYSMPSRRKRFAKSSKELANPRLKYEPRNTSGVEAKASIWPTSTVSIESGRERLGRFWTVEPSIRRVVNGCPSRVERLKLLGNGQVVQCVQYIGEQLMEFARHG